MNAIKTITALAAFACLSPEAARSGDSRVPDQEGRTMIPLPVTDEDYYEGGKPSPSKVELGRLLFFDKILSGNRNISCATCHHPEHGSSDAVALSFGEGARGLGPERRPGTTKEDGVHGRIPRNSPALFNLGAREFERLFHDGRVETDSHGYYEGGFITPAKWKLPAGLENPLAAQAMFPMISADEMAGQKGENEIADAVSLNRAAGPGGAWDLLAERLRAIPEYRALFRKAYPGDVTGGEDLTIVRAANAIAAFEATAFRSDNSPFDRFVRGERKALDESAMRGMELFYGKAKCADCHTGKFQTDHGFHAIAMPQVGPGKGDGQDAAYWRASGHRGFLEDHGRGRVTKRKDDNFKFRTPSLRNVTLTGPWGHSGAYDSLRDVVRHHLDPAECLDDYEAPEDLLIPLSAVLETTARGSSLGHQFVNATRLEGFNLRDTWITEQAGLRERIRKANELDPVALTEPELDDLLGFLGALTDPDSARNPVAVPGRVPSQLPTND